MEKPANISSISAADFVKYFTSCSSHFFATTSDDGFTASGGSELGSAGGSESIGGASGQLKLAQDTGTEGYWEFLTCVFAEMDKTLIVASQSKMVISTNIDLATCYSALAAGSEEFREIGPICQLKVRQNYREFSITKGGRNEVSAWQENQTTKT